jgi:4-hydroxybenzoate polyprenyltransferase
MLAAVGTVTAGLTALGIAGFIPDGSYLPFLCAYVLLVAPPAARAYREPSPRFVGLGVKWGVLGLVLLDAAFAASFAGLLAGAVVAALLIPSILISRAFAVT